MFQSSKVVRWFRNYVSNLEKKFKNYIDEIKMNNILQLTLK